MYIISFAACTSLVVGCMPQRKMEICFTFDILCLCLVTFSMQIVTVHGPGAFKRISV